MQQQPQNYQGDELSFYLENVLNSDMNIRKNAENKINSLCDLNFGQFLIELSKKISTEQEKKPVRQLSATIIKNMLNKEGYSTKWFQLNEEIKLIIKNNVLSTLASNDVDIRKAAALTVAGICKIEIPNKQWLNIFNNLASTCQNENINIQLSSLTCLEYIFEEIKQSDLPLNIVADLLNIIYSLLNKENINEELCYYALKATHKFLPFIKEFVKNKDSQIKFYDLIEKYIRNNNNLIREISLKIFIDLSKIYYNFLENYIDKIFNFSVSIIQEDIERNKILCMEIWINIGNEEDYRLNVINQVKKPYLGLLQKYHVQLSELCLKFIVTEDYYTEEYNISSESFFLLSIMSRTCNNDFLKNMINYISTALGGNQDQPEKIKYSGLNVFRAIINTTYKEELYPIIKDSLGIVSQILLDNKYPTHFKKLCAFILKSITKNFGEELVSDTIYFNKMIQLYLSLFPISTKEVLFPILLSLSNLCKAVVWNEKDQTNVLSKHMQLLCDNLFKIVSNISLYDPDYNIILMAFHLLGSLAEKAALDVKNYMINNFKFLNEMFIKTLKLENFPNAEICYNYQNYLASNLQAFLMTGMATPDLAANLLKYLIETFKMRKELYEEGLALIGNICQFTKEDFKVVMDLISPYLIQGLKSTDSYDICKTSILCLSDIIQGLGESNNYIGDFLPLIMQILSNNNIDRNLKPWCFNIISDIFIHCKEEGFKYFQDIMSVIGGAMTATKINLPDDTEIETINHFIDLREHLLENIACIFNAVKDISKTKEFIPYVEEIIKYLIFIANDALCYKLTILIQGICLIGDFCTVYQKDLKPLLNSEELKDIITKIENDKEATKDQRILIELDWAKKSLNLTLS